MNFEDLKVIWDRENPRPAPTLDEEALRQMVMKRAGTFRRQIFWRDWREIGVAMILLVHFLWKGMASVRETGGTLSLLGLSHFVMVIGVAFVAGVIWVSSRRQKRREANCADTMEGNLQKLISHLNLQIRLLRNVGWWYLLPLVPGVLLSIVATSDDNVEFLERGLFVVLIFGGVLWLNLRVARKQLMPEKRGLEAVLESLENGGGVLTAGFPRCMTSPPRQAGGFSVAC